MRSFAVEQRLHSPLNIVTYRPDFLNRQSLRVLQWPIVSTQTGNIRALVAASHCDKELRLSRLVIGQLLRLGVAEIDSDFLHYVQDLWMHAQAGFCTDCWHRCDVSAAHGYRPPADAEESRCQYLSPDSSVKGCCKRVDKNLHTYANRRRLVGWSYSFQGRHFS